MAGFDSLPLLLKNKNLYLMLVGEAALFALALLLAYGLRFEFDIPQEFFRQMLTLLPISVAVKMTFFAISGLYRGMWRYTALSDLWRIGRAVFLAECLLILYVVFAKHFQGYPRSIFILDPLLAFVFACGARVFIRSVYEFSARPVEWKHLFLPTMFCTQTAGTRALLIGADDDAARMAKEILDTPGSGYCLLGFVDDDPARIGRRIHGLPVYGPMAGLADLARSLLVEEIMISLSRNLSDSPRHILDACEAAQMRVKRLPAIADIASGKVSIKTLRDIRYEDLLGRTEAQLDVAGIESYLKGKVVLVTGAGGSIGSELCRQIIKFEPARIVLYDAGEANLYAIEMELRHEFGFDRYAAVLGQVQDERLLNHTFARHKPQVVFHAAAYKHVPMLELNPWQAVVNNIEGSRCVMDLAEGHGVERFVLVSTDKAVRPTNVMGASKRVAELIMQARPKGKTRFMAVRFGNVLGSSGSVIPLFRRQIARGGPVTVTHPDVTRYFMTIPEAAQLIVQAGALGKGGEIFILKMGRPVRITDLARDLIVLSGKSVEEIGIRFTGLRPGEKLFEELITEGEGIVETGHEKILVLRPGEDGIDIDPDLLSKLLEAGANFQTEEIIRLMTRIVPEYSAQRDGV